MDLELLVSSFGHEVYALAISADEAAIAAAECRPDIALMDIRLARGGSGIEAALSPFQPLGFVGKPILPVALKEALKQALSELDKG